MLKGIYGDDKAVAALKEDDVIEASESLKTGVPVATPVFDGAHEGDVTQLLEAAGLDSSGQVTLYDGRTGEEFEAR